MKEYIEQNLGKADIEIAGLQIWVHGRQFPDSHDYWDGNWLSVTACCEAKGACVWVAGNIIHLSEIHILLSGAEKLYRDLKGKAELPCMEPELSLELTAKSQGQIEMTVDITPDNLSQGHSFMFKIDQSYLPGLLTGCKKVMHKFPVKGGP